MPVFAPGEKTEGAGLTGAPVARLRGCCRDHRRKKPKTPGECAESAYPIRGRSQSPGVLGFFLRQTQNWRSISTIFRNRVPNSVADQARAVCAWSAADPRSKSAQRRLEARAEWLQLRFQASPRRGWPVDTREGALAPWRVCIQAGSVFQSMAGKNAGLFPRSCQ